MISRVLSLMLVLLSQLRFTCYNFTSFIMKKCIFLLRVLVVGKILSMAGRQNQGKSKYTPLPLIDLQKQDSVDLIIYKASQLLWVQDFQIFVPSATPAIWYLTSVLGSMNTYLFGSNDGINNRRVCNDSFSMGRSSALYIFLHLKITFETCNAFFDWRKLCIIC